MYYCIWLRVSVIKPFRNLHRARHTVISVQNSQSNWQTSNELYTSDVPRELSLTHWGRATHICFGKLTIIGSDNGLSPGRRQAIIWTNAGILLIGPLGTILSEILIGIQSFSFRKMHLKISSAKWRPFCLGLNEWRCVTDGYHVACPQPVDEGFTNCKWPSFCIVLN